MPPLNLVGDFGGGGMMLAFGVACAVIEARASGRGQVVDAAMVDAARRRACSAAARAVEPRSRLSGNVAHARARLAPPLGLPRMKRVCMSTQVV